MAPTPPRGPWSRLRVAAAPHRGTHRFAALPTPEICFTVFVMGTALAISPVGQRVDELFAVKLVGRDDGLTYWFLHDVLDRLSSQRVAGVALVTLALWLTWRVRTLAPLVVAGIAQGMFAVTGVVKIVLAKSSTKVGEPTWWTDGLLEHGKHSMAYPSGHATESVLLWGAVVLLLTLYWPGWDDALTRWAKRLWKLVIATTVIVSWAMGRHWVSDLASGLVFGALMLRLLVGLCDRGYPQGLADLALPRARVVRSWMRRTARVARGHDAPA